MKFSRLGLAASGVVSLASAAQIPLSLLPNGNADLATLKHPSLPAHALRVTSPPGSLCDDSVRSYSGYLDVDLDKLQDHEALHDALPKFGNDASLHSTAKGTTEHFYFWAFESRNDPKTDPVVLWLNGGPGCSSFTGLLMELGPCNAIDPKSNGGSPGTARNPWAWNNNATLIFLDQPVGVGYSYVSWNDKKRQDKPPSRVFSGPASARDASAFLHLLASHAGKEIFGDTFTTDRSDDVVVVDGETGQIRSGYPSFHIAGESYAGRYLPLIANQILEDNKQAEAHPERGIKPLPLASVLIGNGITSPKDQFVAYVDYTCTNASGKPDGTPLLPKNKCDRMYASIPTCMALVDKCNRKELDATLVDGPYDSLACQTASTYCEGALAGPYDDLNASPYDWQHPPDYVESQWVNAFLNAPATKTALGVDAKGPGDRHDGVFVDCSDKVYENFQKTGDGARDTTWAVSNILNQGVRVLTYSGKRDFICNYVGNRKWAEALEWRGSDEFRKAPLEAWFVDRESKVVGGQYKTANGFTYAIVDAAGHFVPHDQPSSALTMFNHWLHHPGNGEL